VPGDGFVVVMVANFAKINTFGARYRKCYGEGEYIYPVSILE